MKSGKTKFEWGPEQHCTFKYLKEAHTAAPVLIPYRPGRETLVICKGSPDSLEGALLKMNNNQFTSWAQD